MIRVREPWLVLSSTWVGKKRGDGVKKEEEEEGDER